jgi:acyl-CoA synthetase (AMP-forming)/AMP-acid ligase II
MPQPHLLDRRIADHWPDLSTAAAVAAFEAVPYDERIAARSTYEALRLGRDANPDAPAISFLPNARADDAPQVISHREFFRRVTQAANGFAALGVAPGRTVSLLLPLVPQAFCALYGAEAAGIANPVNGLLEPYQLVEILRAAHTQVLVTLGPLADTEVWDKVDRIRNQVPGLAAIVAVGGASVATAFPGDAPPAARCRSSTSTRCSRPSPAIRSPATASSPTATPPRTSTPAAPLARPSWCATAIATRSTRPGSSG